jgi:arylsulfatase A-like enzyme
MPEAITKPDIVFIVLDTQRADRLSCYGYHQQTSPNIDAFASEATLFERAISPGQWTIPAHASLFTGKYPSVHKTTQAYDILSPHHATLAELLWANGYDTVGFSNNALVGVLDNDLRRGFESYYNYGGVTISAPDNLKSLPQSLNSLYRRYASLLEHLSHSVQNRVARSDLLYRLAMNPLLARLWHRFVSAKGNGVRSLRDAITYLRRYRVGRRARPFFLFINLMEAHPPFWPPRRFVRKFVPYLAGERDTRDFVRYWNTQMYCWTTPLAEPLSDSQARVINDLYDACVAYQDHLLGQLFRTLRQMLDNTMVVITADHGEGLGEHGFMGHSFVVYEEVIHAPLIIRYPPLYPVGERVSAVVSTRRLFHTILQAAGATVNSKSEKLPDDIYEASLVHTLHGPDPEKETVLAEAYPPMTLLQAMERHDPDTIERFRCHLLRRAIYYGSTKLIQVGAVPDQLFNMVEDPLELHDMLDRYPSQVAMLESLQATLEGSMAAGQPEEKQAAALNPEEDELVAQRLRDLGYIE